MWMNVKVYLNTDPEQPGESVSLDGCLPPLVIPSRSGDVSGRLERRPRAALSSSAPTRVTSCRLVWNKPIILLFLYKIHNTRWQSTLMDRLKSCSPSVLLFSFFWLLPLSELFSHVIYMLFGTKNTWHIINNLFRWQGKLKTVKYIDMWDPNTVNVDLCRIRTKKSVFHLSKKRI